MTSDLALLEDLRDLPGWDALFDVPAPATSPDNLDRATSAVRAAIARDLQCPTLSPTLSPRGRRKRWVALGLAAAAAAAVLLAVPTLSPPGAPPVSVASAEGFLRNLAATSPHVAGLNDPYWRVRFASVNPRDPAPGSDQQTVTTLWYGREGGQWVQTSGDQRVVRATTAKELFGIPPFTQLTWQQVRGLSSDPVALGAYLAKAVSPRDGQPGGSIVVAAESLLAVAPLDSGQRAALFTILSHQPGVTLREHVTDATGRVGTALDFPLGATETMTLLLADDGTLLEECEVSAADHDATLDAPRPTGSASSSGPTLVTTKGTLLSRQTYLESAGTTTPPGQ